MRAENWKWVEGKQTSFVFCCLVESPLYQLLEGFRNSVCVRVWWGCSWFRIYRRSLSLRSYLISEACALFCGGVWRALF